MNFRENLRVLGFAVAMSAVAPAILAFSGIMDRGLLVIVFLPSVFVGIATAWYVKRGIPNAKSWQFDSNRS